MPTPAAQKPKHAPHGAGGLTPCLGGGGVMPRQKLLRFVAGVDGQIYLDLNHNLEGLGAYVRPELAYLEKALASKALENTLGAKWQGTAEELRQMVLKIVEKQLLNTLGLLRKANDVTTGTDKVIEAAFQGKLQTVLVAADVAENTLKKVTLACEKASVPCLKVCDRSALESALGKDNCTVIGLAVRANINTIQRLVPMLHGLKGLQ